MTLPGGQLHSTYLLLLQSRKLCRNAGLNPQLET